MSSSGKAYQLERKSAFLLKIVVHLLPGGHFGSSQKVFGYDNDCTATVTYGVRVRDK
jgi:hypothetical protein